MLKAIYGKDDVGVEASRNSVQDYVIQATKGERVLPLAILLASGARKTVASGREALQQANVGALVREHLKA